MIVHTSPLDAFGNLPNAGQPAAPLPSFHPSIQPVTLPTVPQSVLPNVGPSISPTGPTFKDIMTRLNTPTSINTFAPIQGGNRTDQALAELAPSTGLRPEIQNVLDLIQKNTADARMRGISEAQALAAKRGITGSSTEQFGVGQAAFNAEKSGRDAETQILLQNAQREQALQDTRAKILADRGTLEGQLGVQVGSDEAKLITEKLLKGADLTSDEIASVRNTDFANKQLGINYLLGQQGLDVARENVNASRDIAADNARNGLYGAGLSAVAPYVLNGLFGGGGGGGGAGLFGGGGGAGAGGGGGGAFSSLFGAGSVGGGGALTGTATGQFVPGVGMVGTGTGAASLGGISAGSVIPAAALGYVGAKAGQSAFGGGNDVGGIAGGVIGAYLGGPVGAGIGSFLGTGAQRFGESLQRKVEKKLGKKNILSEGIGLTLDPVKGTRNVFNQAKKVVKNPGGAVESVAKKTEKVVSDVGKSIGSVFRF